MSQDKEKNQIVQALSAKKEILLSILEIAKEQPKLIDTDDTDLLLEKIDLRKNLIEKLIAAENFLVENGLKNHPYFTSSEAEVIHEELKKIHNDIAIIDQKNCTKAEMKVEEYKKQIKEIKTDKNRLNSYKNVLPNADGIYFDKKK